MRTALVLILMAILTVFIVMASMLPMSALPFLAGAILCMVLFGGLPVVIGIWTRRAAADERQQMDFHPNRLPRSAGYDQAGTSRSSD